jgi:hypothetical protein
VTGRAPRPGALLWLIALVAALGFIAVDGVLRVAALRDVSRAGLGPGLAPVPDAWSATGWDGERHRLLLYGGDGYQWVLHTEEMLAEADPRLRRTATDNAPAGRAVHWSGSMRWWLAGVAWLYQRVRPELSLPLAIEATVPWANTLAVALLILLLTPVFARRFGGAAAALFALGCIATYPFYHFFAAGDYDHHAIAALSGLAAVAFLVAGGGGFVRGETGPGGGSPAARGGRARRPRSGDAGEDRIAGWLPDERVARRWFIASAAAGGIGLWVSASTLAPVLAGVCGGALAGVLLSARSAAEPAGWRAAPQLWRVWGITGFCVSLGFYVLEYFPAHLGLRLEVNHPLYALAWLGAGDLLRRAGRPAAGRNRVWLLLDGALIGLAPAVVLLSRGAVFLPADPFLWALHEDYISEFRGALAHFAGFGPWQLLQFASPLPLLALPVAALLWVSRRGDAAVRPSQSAAVAASHGAAVAASHGAAVAASQRGAAPSSHDGEARVWRGAALVLLAVGLAYAHVLGAAWIGDLLVAAGALPGSDTPGPAIVHVLALLFDAAVFAALFVWPLRSGLPRLPRPCRELLLLAVVPAALLLVLALDQIRWLGTAGALWLAVLVTLAAVLWVLRDGYEWTTPRRIVPAVLVLLALVPYPAFTALVHWRHGYPGTRTDLRQLVTRDVSYALRGRLGARRGVVLSDPTSTTRMMYFGGMRGVGTLYWENLEGLRAAAAIYGARTDEEARRLIGERGITHIVLYSWDVFALEYTRLARGERFDRDDPHGGPRDSFMVRLLQRDTPPPWLVPVPYEMPNVSALRGAGVLIWEVVHEPPT